MVYDTLFANDVTLQPRPQMVDKSTVSRDRMKWSFTLRSGLQFHDGAPVTAEDCVASLLRWGKRDALGRMLLAATGKLQATDKKTFVLELKSPFGIVLEALAKPSSNVPFIMPARLAATARHRAGQGADRLRAVQVRQGAVAARSRGGVREEHRLRAAQRAGQWRRRRQGRPPRPRGVALST